MKELRQLIGLIVILLIAGCNPQQNISIKRSINNETLTNMYGIYIGTPTIGTIGKLIGYYLECNFNIVNNFTEKEKRIFCLGRATSEFAPISERIIFPATVNITYDKFNIIKTYKTVSDFPLTDDCYNETICYVEWH